MATINPYLNFNGNAEEAFNFYKSVFGGEFGDLHRYKDIPSEMPGGGEMSDSDKEKLMHVSLPIGDGNVLMASDIVEAFGKPVTEGNNFSISINAESKEEADRLFNGLSDGGKVKMPLADAFWGAYFGMFQDKFGINWMVNHENSKES